MAAAPVLEIPVLVGEGHAFAGDIDGGGDVAAIGRSYPQVLPVVAVVLELVDAVGGGGADAAHQAAGDVTLGISVDRRVGDVGDIDPAETGQDRRA